MTKPHYSQIRDSTVDPRGGHQGGRRGSALVMVLGVLAAVLLMSLHIVVKSEVVALEANTHARRGQLRYVAESAADLAFWLWITDPRRFSDRRVGRIRQQVASSEERPLLADGETRTMKIFGHPVDWRISAPRTGLDFYMKNNSQAEIDKLVDQLREQLLPPGSVVDFDPGSQRSLDMEEFFDVLSDYVDSNDSIHLNGREETDYANEGMPGMPRNNRLQFREEIFWLDGAEEVLGTKLDRYRDFIQLIPPPGLVFKKADLKFWELTPAKQDDELRRAGLSAGEVLDFWERWKNGGISAATLLPEQVYREVNGRFPFRETGESPIATVQVTAWETAGQEDLPVVLEDADWERGSHRITLRITRDNGKGGKQNVFSDASGDWLAYWERVFDYSKLNRRKVSAKPNSL